MLLRCMLAYYPETKSPLLFFPMAAQKNIILRQIIQKQTEDLMEITLSLQIVRLSGGYPLLHHAKRAFFHLING